MDFPGLWVSLARDDMVRVENFYWHIPKYELPQKGIVDTARIFWNVLTRPAIRGRVLEMRGVFSQSQHDLGYIALCAVALPR